MAGNLTNERTCLFVILDVAAVEEVYASYIINIVLNVSLAPPTIVLNLIVLASIWRTFSLHTPSNIFICSLALSDLCIGLITIPFYVAYKVSSINNKYDEYCTMGIQVVALFFLFFLAGVSFATLTAMSIDRYLALHLGMRYRAVVTTSRVTKAVVGLWIFGVCLGSLQFFLSSQMFSRVVAGAMVFFLAIMAVAYVNAFKALKHHQSQMAKTQSSNSAAKYRRTLYVVLYIIGFILVCYLPILCVFIAIAIKGLTGATRAARNIANPIVMANSCLNPLLYCWKITEIRRACRNTVRKVLCKENTTDNAAGTIYESNKMATMSSTNDVLQPAAVAQLEVSVC